MDIRFFVLNNLKATLSAAAGSVCIKTKCVEIQPSSIPGKPLDEIYQFHSLRCSLLPCRDLHFRNLNSSISQIFDNALFLFSENSTFGPKPFINISSRDRAPSQVNSSMTHFGCRTTTRQHLSSAPLALYPLLRMRVYWPSQISFWAPMLRRTVFIT